MKFSKQDLIRIVERSSTISERLSAGFTPNEPQTNYTLIGARLEKWCQVVAGKNKQKFEKRLAWDDLDVDTVSCALGSVCLADEQLLPSWAKTFTEAMQIAASLEISEKGASLKHCYLNSKRPFPFEEVLVPFVEVARKRLVTQANSNYQLLSQTARSQLESRLLEQLTGLAAFALELEFSIFRSFNNSPLIRLIGQLQDIYSRKQYTEFIKGLLNGGLLSFFQEYSVLARLIATAVDFWVEATEEFLRRLASDWLKIQETFQGNVELGQVVAIKSALSDSHNRGRSVIIVKFASGLKLVYKPKDLGLEQAYFELLAWLNEQDISLPFKLLKVINCSTHGWMEFAEALPCQDQEEIKRFYQRAGIMLCLIYVLRGTDCHYENLIACGEQPVLVDLETLLHHRTWISGDDADAQSIANQRLQDSVAGTALLPGWQLVPYAGTEGLRLDFSGLGDFGEREMHQRVLKWNHINTDSMAIEHEYIKMLPKQNRPFREGVKASLSDYGEELVDGFRQMYHFLTQRKEALLAPGSRLAAFAHQKVRLVFRNTNVYFSILQKSLNPKYLRDGVERSIELDILSRAFLSWETKHPFWSFLKAEQKALEQLDIPYFTAYSDSDALIVSPDQTIEKFLAQPSYDDVISRLQQFNDTGLAQQISFIRGSLYSCMKSETHNSLPLESVEVCLDALAPLTGEAILQQAITIAQELQQRAIRGNNGTVAWIGMGYMSEAQKFQLQPLGYSLYDGYCGISLFLAALASVTGRAEFGNLALAALQSLRKAIYDSDSDSQQKLTEQMGIGGVKGLASIVYAFVRIGEFLGEAELIQDAQKIASWMTLNETTVHQSPGIMNGAAGTILSLLALYKATQEPATLMQATVWGKHLLDSCITTDANYKTCTNSDQKLLTGFFDGAAGIAYALLQLHIATKNLVFLSAAESAIAYEQKVFSVKGNCPNFKLASMDNGTLSSMTGWCNGASGIAIARLGRLAVLAQHEILQETEIALQITAQSDLHALDNLYCGNFGHIEVLLSAARQLSYPELLEIAQKQAASVVTRANRSGCFQLLPNLPDEVYNPGFFLGKAGIGYELLRLIHPHLLPSVLLWQ
ncbi:type 2 lanthipeptide synthetase LanM family protein [Nostoc sp.]|uniref:type 2 lanthipeptide synthetase LanM family protein n=1 Tax=Nostoc sp. TaxID=1180 RepID=UPI002FFC497F